MRLTMPFAIPLTMLLTMPLDIPVLFDRFCFGYDISKDINSQVVTTFLASAKVVDNLVVIQMPNAQFIVLKNKTQNCFAKFTKHQKYGAKCWDCGVRIFSVFSKDLWIYINANKWFQLKFSFYMISQIIPFVFQIVFLFLIL